MTALRLTFNRDIDFASVQAADLTLTTGTVTGVTSIDASGDGATPDVSLPDGGSMDVVKIDGR